MNEHSQVDALQSRIGYQFGDSQLLQVALTHKSYANEQGDSTWSYNERLEFLGDAVLGLAVSQYVFETFSALSEGEMSRIRSEVVSESCLAAIARRLELGGHLLLGRGEERSGGRNKSSLLANVLEALFGAVFCDGGFAAARQTIHRLLADEIVQSARRKAGIDYKTRLQEHFQKTFGRTPVYHLVGSSGPDHDRLYRVEVLFDGDVIGSGEGSTKKRAEQLAAGAALNTMNIDG
ncbi:RNAse III [Geoalkalibacter ferrihydriticus]|uniref:Ribonuclease 3 n=2 Tax=Geoalkalibacter ferrihydriticus TaxID=392333 RepID=A0A0C2HX57_9BACT|nr:ribonuclease III [Geoalkalibacter ferrihydriticus]KIH77362.1 ribonuclease III [Geoalkalibacter ferrihydriticus DSM 17813]SDM18139.1 RNAse III [Geoalkalibacter ferrihydriticus]